MTTRTFAAIAIALLAAIRPAGAGTEPPSHVDRSLRVAEVRGLTGVDVDNARGSVELKASPDNLLHVTATRVIRMGTEAEVRKYTEQTTVDCGPKGNRYVVAVHYPKRIETHFDFFDLFSERGRQRLEMPRIEVRLELLVPANFAATVGTASGDVSANGLAGALDVRTASGDVNLDGVTAAHVRTASGGVIARATGRLDAGTASGDVQVTAARDSITLSSQSGDVTVDGAPGGVRAHTVSGELTVRGAATRADLATVSGDLEARLQGPLANASLTSVSGDVDLRLAGGMGARLSAKTLSGSLECNGSVTLQHHDRNELEATIGGGGTPIRVKTTSGNITVTSGGQ